jgi:hypothetical protein
MSTAYSRGAGLDSQWPQAAVAGAVAGLARPVAVGVLSALNIDPGVLSMTLQPEIPMWWLIHLGYSFAFGAVYGLVIYRGRLQQYVADPTTGLFVGTGYGIALWVVNVVVMWELVWTNILPVLTLGAEGSIVGPLAGHLIYGLGLGVLYPLARRYG